VLEIAGDGLEFRVDDGWRSPSYGRRISTPFIHARKRTQPGDDVTAITLAVQPARA
jgi:hypothetical protein